MYGGYNPNLGSGNFFLNYSNPKKVLPILLVANIPSPEAI
jgi:hypothetical protein